MRRIRPLPLQHIAKKECLYCKGFTGFGRNYPGIGSTATLCSCPGCVGRFAEANNLSYFDVAEKVGINPTRWHFRIRRKSS